jgi:uncharacterized delta-60 repeat protein
VNSTQENLLMRRQASTKLKLTNLEDRLTPAGWLDPNFGNGGVAKIGPLTESSSNITVAQPDGKLLVAVFEFRSTPDDVYGGKTSIVRLNPDGSVDSSFGTNGKTLLREGRSFPADVELSPNGDILVLDAFALYSQSNGNMLPYSSMLRRLTADGKLDARFDGDGIMDVQGAIDVAVRADDSIIVNYGSSRGVTVYDATGVEIANFGITRPDFVPDGRTDVYDVREIYATTDGGFLTLGTVSRFDPGNHVAAIVSKYHADGSLDQTYGTNGFAVVDLATDSGWKLSVIPIGMDSTGNFVFGLSATAATWQFSPERAPTAPPANEVVRLTSTGQLDTTFAGDGIAEIGVPEAGSIQSGKLLADGRVALITRLDDEVPLAVRVLTAQGASDPNVAQGGWLAIHGPAIQFGSFVADQAGPHEISFGGASALLPDGRIAVTYRNSAGMYSTVVDMDATTPTVSGATLVAEDPVRSGTSRGLIATMPKFSDPVPPPVVANDPPVVANDPPVVANDPPQSPVPTPGDFNNDGVADNVVTSGPTISVLSGVDGSVIIAPFNPFESQYTGTLNYVVVDINGDGVSEFLVAPDMGGGGVVAVYDSCGTELTRFFGIEDANFRGGNSLTLADINSDGTQDLVVTAGAGGGPRVAIFDGLTIAENVTRLQPDFFAFESTQRGGVTAAVINQSIVFGAGLGGAPRIRGLSLTDLTKASRDGMLNTQDALDGFDKFVGEKTLRNGVKFVTDPVVIDGVNYGMSTKADSGEGELFSFHQLGISVPIDRVSRSGSDQNFGLKAGVIID